jgi:hypothetical protein
MYTSVSSPTKRAMGLRLAAITFATSALFHTGAQAAEVASMSLDLTQLQIQVRSLDPTSLVTPAYTITSGSLSTGLPVEHNFVNATFGTVLKPEQYVIDTQAVAARLLPTDSAPFTSSDGSRTISVSPTRIAMTTSVSDTVVENAGWSQQQFNSVEVHLDTGVSTKDPQYGSEDEVNEWLITLPAQTQLSFSGQLNQSLSMDVDRLSQLLSPYANSEFMPTFGIEAGLTADYAYFTVGDNGVQTDGVQSVYLVSAHQYDFDSGGAVRAWGNGPASQQSEVFSMDLVNDSDLTRQYLLHFTALQSAYMNFNGRLPAETSVVPETATWALMGLGLVGLGHLRRRRMPS